MKPISSVEGLGKSYTIRHEGQTHYKSLREEIFKLPSRLLRRGGQSREEFWALKDVSFDIMPGDRVGIIGRNGAGKSTLLKLLSRITEPTTGRITLSGRVASLLEVGTGFHPELTGRENIYLNGAILGMSRAEVRRKFDEIVDFAGVEKFLDTPVKRYSSGMYVRLAFAVAAHLEPEILIVDEVLAVGDAEFQKKCLGKMEEVGKAGRTVLFVSHNMGMVIKLCSKGFFLNSGEINYLGCMKDAVDCYNGLLYDRYASVQKEVDYRRRFTFIKVFTCDRYGCSKNEYKCYESICISIKIFVQQDARRVELALGLLDDNKYRIFSIYESLEKYQVKNGVVSLLISFPEGFIAPGRFSWVMCTHTPGIEAYDNLEDVCHFSILDHDSVYARYPAGGFGAVVPQYMILSIDG